MRQSPVADVAVVGGGIVGLAIARELSRRGIQRTSAINNNLPTKPFRCIVLEKERTIARHQTQHNSGVVHAGIYYRPQSQRASLGVLGARLMREFLSSHPQLPSRVCGKLILAVAHNDGQSGISGRGKENAGIAELFRRALANGVPDVELWIPRREFSSLDLLTTRQGAVDPAFADLVEANEPGLRILSRRDFNALVAEREPKFAGPHVTAALLSPHSAITDFAAVAHAFAHELETELGGKVQTSFEASSFAHEVTSDRNSTLVVSAADGRQPPVFARHVITCAGLHADQVASLTGGSSKPPIVPVRGEWRLYRKEFVNNVRGLVYPVPDPRFPFLGVHFTPTVHGDVIFGPNAVLATHREGYAASDVSVKDLGDALRTPALWRLALREWRSGLGEIQRAVHTPSYVKLLKQYMPEIDESHLQPDKKLTGVRALALTDDGHLMEDFHFERSPSWPSVLHVRNAPSPAATASLAIAKAVADLAEREFASLYETSNKT